MDFFDHYFTVQYGDIIVFCYHENMRDVCELLNNRNNHKTRKVFLEYCSMIDVKVVLEPLKGEKSKGLKAAIKHIKEYDIAMSEEQIQQVREAMSSL